MAHLPFQIHVWHMLCTMSGEEEECINDMLTARASKRAACKLHRHWLK